MRSFTNYFLNKAHTYRLSILLQFAIILFFLFVSQIVQAQCPPQANGPVVIATPSSAIFCSGVLTPVTLTSGSGGTTFSWTSNPNGVAGSTDGTTSTILDTLSAYDVIPGTVDYTITADSSGCLGPAITITLTVNPIPLAIAGPLNPFICSGANTSTTLSSDVAGATFAWTVIQSNVSGGSDGFGNSISQVLTAAGTFAKATYNIVATANGCASEPINDVVKVRQTPTVAVNPTSQTVCSGAAISTINISNPNNVSGTTFGWVRDNTVNLTGIATSGSGATINGTITNNTGTSQTTVFTITATASGCPSSTITASVTVDPTGNPGTVSGLSPICIGQTTTYSSSGNPGGTWTSDNTGVATVDPSSGLVTGVSAGTATITYTILGCSGTASQTITVSPNANPGVVSGTSPLCVGATATYSSNGDAGGSWSSTNPLIASVDAVTGLVTALSVGTTDITYTVPGCNGVSHKTLTVSPDATPGVVSGTSPLCIGGTATYSSDGDAGGSWSSANPLVASVDAVTGLVTALTAGSTDITYTLNSGCNSPASSHKTLTVSLDANPGVVSGTSPLCIGATATYSSDGDAGGSWSSTNPLVANVDSVTGLVTALTAGSTDITYTLNSGCNNPASSHKTLTVNPDVNPGAVSGTSPLCIGATATYSSDGDAGGSWSSTNPLVASVDAVTGLVTALTAGSTDITYTLNSGCNSPASSHKTLTVSPDVNPGVVSGTSPLCIGATATYSSDGDAGGSWSSTNPLVASVDAATGFVTALTAGSTDITYTLNSGCNSPASSHKTLTVSPDANPGVVSGTSPLCIGATATYSSDGDAGGSWSSTNPLVANVDAVTGLVTALTAGSTDITYTLNSGCNSPVSSHKTLTVSPDANPGAVSGTSPLCIGATATYTSNGDAGGSWSSTNPLVASVDAVTGLVTALTAGSTDITYTLNSGCNSPASSHKTLTVSPNVNAGTISGITPLCIGTSDGYTSNGDAGGTWSSSDGTVATVNSITGVVTAVSAGTADITYTVNGCGGSVSTFVSLTVTPTNSGTISGTTPLCISSTSTYSTDGSSGGVWSSSNPVVASVDPSSGLVSALSAGSTDITYTLVGCSSSSILTLTVSPNVNAGVVSGTNPLCIGGTATYSSDGDAGGSWSSTNPLVASVDAATGLVTALTAGSTDITYTLNSGCNSPASSHKTLTVSPDANAGIVSGTSPLCIGGTATYSSNGDAGGSWNSTNPLVASVDAVTGLVTALSSGTTDITYTAPGCNGVSHKTLTVSPDANPGVVSGTSPLCIGGTATYSSNGDAGGSWSSTNPLVASVDAVTGLVTALTAGSTDITYTLNSGCNNPASSHKTLTVSPDANPGVVSGTSPLCIGATATYSSDGDAGGSWSSTNPLVASVDAVTGLVTALTAGSTDITYTLNSGCNSPVSSHKTLTVSPDANPGAVSGTSPLCIGATATYSSDGDAGGSWSSTNPLVASVDAVTGLVTALTAGSTDITYTLNSGCNSPASSHKTLTVSPDVNPGVVSGTSPLCIGATATYSSDGDAGGSWSSTNPLVASVDAVTGLVTALTAGSTDITYTLNSGCNSPVSSHKTLTVSPDANPGAVSGTSPLCIGATATYSSDGDAGGSWSSTNPLVASVDAVTGLVTALTAGSTDITYTLNSGCNSPVSSHKTLTVSPDANPGAVSGTSPLCIGATATYSSDGDAGGSWSSTNPLAASVDAVTGLVTALTAGSTDITYTLNSGCNSPASSHKTLTVSPNVNAGTISGITPLCIGTSDGYTSNGDAGGTWSSSDGTVATVNSITGVVTAVSAGTADITYTVNGCGGSVSTFVSLTVTPTNSGTISGTTPLCISSTSMYSTDGSSGGVWSSSNPVVASVDPSSGLVSALSAGSTDITYTLVGCSSSSILTLTVSPNVNAGVVSGTNPLCIGGTATYSSDGDAGGSWSSTNPLVASVDAATGLVIALTAGSTDITYTLNSGCNSPASSHKTLTVSPDVNPGVVSGTSPLCIGATATYSSNGDAGGSWNSTNPLVASVDAATGLVTALTAGSTDITYTLNSGCNSPASSHKTLTISPDANPGVVSGTSPLCIGATATYSSNGDAGGSWSSTNPLIASVDAVTGLVTALTAGSTDITYTLNSGCNSPASSHKTLTVSPDANAGVVSGTTPLCIGTTDTYTSNGDIGGTWNSSDASIASVDAITGAVIAISAGTVNIIYTVTGCNGPSVTSLTLTVNPSNSGTVSGTSPLCIGAITPYTSNGDPGGAWGSTNTSVATVNAVTGEVTAVSAGTTNITYTLVGCSISSTKALTVNPDVNAGTVSGISPLCMGTTDTYTSNGDTGGIWNSSDASIASVDAVTGAVIAVSAGTVNIIYTVTGCNGPASAILPLTVNSTNSGTVSGTSPLCIGAITPYTSNGDPGGAWGSTNTSVATVNAVTGEVTAVSAGTTNITYTLVGCSISSTKALTVNPDVNAGTVSGISPLCMGTTDTYTSNGDTGGIWNSTDASIASVDAVTGAVIAVSAGTVNIIYTVTGCNGPASAILPLTVNSTNSGTVSGTSPLCIGAIVPFATDGTPGGTWTSTNTAVATVNSITGEVTAVSAGTTSIIYTLVGCSASSSLSLTINPDASGGTVSGTSPLCIGATATYSSDGDAGGSWSSTNPLVTSVDVLTGLVTALTAGTTDITYTLSSGCNSPVSSHKTLTISPNVDAGIISGTSPLCILSTNLFTSSGDAGGSWSTSDPAVATVDPATGMVTAVGAGIADIIYSVTGCNGPATAFLPLIVNSRPTVTATGKNLTCFNTCNGIAIATVTGGAPIYTYIWSSGATDTTLVTADTIRGLCASGYTITVTDMNGCADTDAVTLIQPTQVSATFLTDNVTCNGLCNGAIDATPTGGTAPYSYAWNTGATDSLITSLCPGVYTLIVRDSLGCSNTLPDTVIQTPAVVANAVVINAACGLCNGSALLAPSGGIAPYTYVWGNGQTSDSLTQLCAGVYSVNITDNAGCSAIFSIPVSNSGGPTSATITSTNVTCFGLCNGAVTAITPAGGTAPYTFLWIGGGQTTATLSNLCSGIYYVQIADANGCALVDSITITQPNALVVNQFVTAATCNVCDGSVTIVPGGSAGPYAVLWNTGSTSDTLQSLCAGFYSVQVTDAAGCNQHVIIPVNSQNGASLTTAVVTGIQCNGSCNGVADVIAVGGTSPYTYLWNDPGAQTNDTATALCGGTYFVRVTTASGCVSFASVNIPQPPPFGFGLANIIEPLCNGNSNGSITAVPSGGSLPYTFSWSSSPSSTSDSVNMLSPGSYTVTVTDAHGCTATQTDTLVNPPPLTISSVITNASCNTIADGAIDITVAGGTPGYAYQWSGGSTQTTQDLTSIFIGSYIVTVTDTNACTKKDTMVVTSTVTVIANAGNDTAYCAGGTALLLNAAGSSANVVNYQWSELPANTVLGNSQTVSVTPASPTTSYYVMVNNGAGCTDNDTIIVTINPPPAADAGADVSVLLGANTVIGGNPTGSVGSTYQWSPSSGLDNSTGANPVATPTVTTTYAVTVTSAQGCVSTDFVIVTVAANITFSDGISPNGDGANDVWIIDNIDLFPKSKVEVYNRWGELLFQSVGYKEKWDGTYKGQPLPIGTYYYIINLNDPLFPDAYTGPVTILR